MKLIVGMTTTAARYSSGIQAGDHRLEVFNEEGLLLSLSEPAASAPPASPSSAQPHQSRTYVLAHPTVNTPSSAKPKRPSEDLIQDLKTAALEVARFVDAYANTRALLVLPAGLTRHVGSDDDTAYVVYPPSQWPTIKVTP